jgi:quinol monooxygenase YgiN
MQSKDDETKFVLLEHFRDNDAIEYHKTTEHYKKWASTVNDMMASPRTKTVCEKVE